MLILIALVLLALGGGMAFLAPSIQRLGLAMMGRPQHRLAALSHDIAGSNMALRSIRMSGLMCFAVGGVLLVLALRAR